jgi:hypothetical protein
MADRPDWRLGGDFASTRGHPAAPVWQIVARKRPPSGAAAKRVLTEHPEILQDSSGGQWPITELVVQPNNRFPPRTWTGDWVDNAKRRLLRWIKRLRRKNGLDEVDLEALFARVARQQERGGPTSANRLHRQLNPRN